ncbi:MAG: hypothetical protein KZQ93_15545 [Candidatus Thiodiazotropha sp. (ex Monitilora ramsayi)]|nr:hypothetical protein [Candidatus Thiodiazotropha sp. (ex Monitilora ramsayi)]
MKHNFLGFALYVYILFGLIAGFAVAAEHEQQPNESMKGKANQSHSHMHSMGARTAGKLQASLEVMPYDAKSQAALKKFGIIATHHIMMTLVDTEANALITNAKVMAWTENPETGNKSPKARLISMKMSRIVGYGGDVKLSSEKGTEIVIESIAADGQKHLFRF